MAPPEEFFYDTHHQATYEIFMASIADFPARHSRILSLERSTIYQKDVGVGFEGTLTDGSQFLFGYSYETAREAAHIDMAIPIARISTTRWQIDERDVRLLTYRVHRDYPETESFFINDVRVHGQRNVVDVFLWGTLWPVRGVTMEDVHGAFHTLTRVTPRVRMQLFPPTPEVYKRLL